MIPATSVLSIEDNPGDARLLREMFREGGSFHTRLTHVGSMRDAEAELLAPAVDIILLDLGLPDAQGLGAVRRAHAAAPRIPLVVLTGLDDDAIAIQALQEGAQDYLVKGQVETRDLLRALRYAMERKTMEDALFAEKERAQTTLDSIGDAVICTDISGNITFLNVVAEKLTGWSWSEAAGQQLALVFDKQVEVSDRQSVAPLSSSASAPPPAPAPAPADNGRPAASNFTLVRRDGREIPIEESVAPISDRDGNAAGAVIVFRDVSATRAMALQIKHAAEHDFLTGLPNRLLLNDRIKQAIGNAKRHSKQVAVLFLDLDGFKHINDSLGHSVGDKLLQSIGRRLVDTGRASDTVGRQGGDEFVVLLSEVARSEDAAVAASRMLLAVSEAHCVDHHELHVTTSIGVSVYPDDGQDAETLIKNADTAMYQAKESGRHDYQYFKPAMNARAVERRTIEEGLRRALERKELSLHYQPKIDFRTGEIVGAEALLRWRHPKRGAVSPAEFIPVAEECGLILPIGKWVLREACQQAQLWLAAGLPVTTMAVNVSAKQFRGASFLPDLLQILKATGLDPGLLELELTESVLMKHAESAADILHTLRQSGVQVAVDDFGTGYSSLSYLRKFPIDALKIDQSFVGRIGTAAEDASIVRAVIGMAQSLNLRVVAEGVETREQSLFLQAQDCDEAQGYYFSRPVAPEQFARLLREGIEKPLTAAEPARSSKPPVAV